MAKAAKYTATITLAPWQRDAIQHYQDACDASRHAALDKSVGWDLNAEKDYWKQFWRNDDGACAGGAAYTFTARFDDGYEMDVKLCGCQDEAPWTEAVLFGKPGYDRQSRGDRGRRNNSEKEQSVCEGHPHLPPVRRYRLHDYRPGAPDFPGKRPWHVALRQGGPRHADRETERK